MVSPEELVLLVQGDDIVTFVINLPILGAKLILGTQRIVSYKVGLRLATAEKTDFASLAGSP